MAEACFISIDIGTSSTKVVLMAQDGTCLAAASREYGTIYEENGGVVQNAEDWWEAALTGIRTVIQKCPGEAALIEAISIDGQSSTVLPVAKDGRLLSHAMIWTDHRAAKQEQYLCREPGQKLFTEINGNHINASNIAPKIMWLRENRTEIYKETWKFFTSTGFMVYRLTGKASCDVTDGGLSQLMDMKHLCWSEELVKACRLDMEKLPALYRSYEVVGTVLPDVAEFTGLRPDVQVVAGAMDVCACALGTGVDRVGSAVITGGTVMAVGVATDAPIMNGRLHVYPHIVPDIWLSVAGVDFGGGNYRWFRDQFMMPAQTEHVYEEMNQLAEKSSPGSQALLFLPSLVGQRGPQWDLDMRGAFVGVSAQHGKPDFLRAIMEGNAFGIREIMDIQRDEGAEIKDIMIAGGIAKSALWLQIIAQILHMPLWHVQSQQDTAYGNLINAAYGIGIYDSLTPALSGRTMRKVLLTEENAGVYDQMYGLYCEMYPSLKHIFSGLAQIREEKEK